MNPAYVSLIKQKADEVKENKLLHYVGYGILGITTVGISYAVIKNIVKTARRNQQLREAGSSQNPQTYATMLKQAFDNDTMFGWGTDEEAVYNTLRSITSLKLWYDVQKSYKAMYGKELMEDLTDELSVKELNQAFSIIDKYR